MWGRRNKFNAKRTSVDGVNFHSKAEAMRYLELKMLAQAGKITELRLQPEFFLQVAGVPICRYLADFLYVEDGKRIIEDVKGFETDVFKLKWKLVHALYGSEYQFRIVK